MAPWVYAALGSLRGLFGERAPLTALFFLLCALAFTLNSLVSGFTLLGSSSGSAQLRWGALLIDSSGTFVAHEPWRYLSAVFFHFGAIHLAFNMMALGGLGGALEPKLGSARFAVVFVVAGTLGFVAGDYFHRFMGDTLATGGASGALFGLMGASAAYKFAVRERDWKRSMFGLLALVVIMTFLIPSSMMNLDHAAHLGGLGAGLVLGYGLGRERRPERLGRLFQVGAAACVLASGISLVACQLSTEWKLQRQLELQWGLDSNSP